MHSWLILLATALSASSAEPPKAPPGCLLFSAGTWHVACDGRESEIAVPVDNKSIQTLFEGYPDQLVMILGPSLTVRDDLMRYNWQTGDSAKMPFPPDVGIKILNDYRGHLRGTNRFVFSSEYRTGPSKPFISDGKTTEMLGDFKKYRFRIGLHDVGSDGSILFTDLRKFSGRHAKKATEDKWYLGVFLNQQMPLLYRSGLSGKIEQVGSGGRIYHARLMNRGTHGVYIRPGRADEGLKRKTFIIESVNLATKEKRELTTINHELVRRRHMPPLRFFTQSPWLMIDANDNEDGHQPVTEWKLVNVVTGDTWRFVPPKGTFVLDPVDSGKPYKGMTQFRPYVVLAQNGPAEGEPRKVVTEFTVLSVPEMKPIFSHRRIGWSPGQAVYLSVSDAKTAAIAKGIDFSAPIAVIKRPEPQLERRPLANKIGGLILLHDGKGRWRPATLKQDLGGKYEARSLTKKAIMRVPPSWVTGFWQAGDAVSCQSDGEEKRGKLLSATQEALSVQLEGQDSPSTLPVVACSSRR